MSDELLKPVPVWRKTLLSIIAVTIVLAMVRLGFWQLDRAEQKQVIVNQLESRAEQAATPIEQLFVVRNNDDLRFRKVSFKGRYLTNRDFFVDNQVVNGQVGYQVFTPFRVNASDQLLLVARGWVPVGESRDVLPKISTSPAELMLYGRLNMAPQKPPLWNDKYPVSSGSVWQYLPISDVENVLQVKLFPLVVELAPDENDNSTFIRKWPEISDEWVAKHQGYAFQWFAMALAFLVASLVLLIRSSSRRS